MQIDYGKALKAVGIVIAVYFGMTWLLPLIFPFLLAWILVRIIAPWTRWIRKHWHIRQEVSGAVLLFLLGIFAGGICYLLVGKLVTQICSLAANFDEYLEQFGMMLHSCCRVIEKNTGIHAQAAEKVVYEGIEAVERQIRTSSIPGMLKNSIGYLFSAVQLLGIFVMVFISILMFLRDDEKICQKLREGKVSGRVQKVLTSMQSLGGAWIRAQLLIILMVSVLCVLGLWLMGNSYALLLGILIGLLDALPFIGTGTILIPWAIYCVITGDLGKAAGLGLLFFMTNTLREYMEPKLIGERIGIYPVLMMAAVYIGLKIYGGIGVLLGPVSLLLIWELWKETGILDDGTAPFDG